MSGDKYFMHIHEGVYCLMSSGKYYMHIHEEKMSVN